jgi:hypothetical protein
MWRTRSASSVTNRLGPMQHGDPGGRVSALVCLCFEGGTRRVGVVVSGRFTMLLQGFELGDVNATPARLVEEPRAAGFRQQRAFEVSQQTPVGDGVQAGVGEEQQDCQ